MGSCYPTEGRLKVSVRTWSPDLNSLIDFESQEVMSQNFLIESSAFFINHTEDLNLLEPVPQQPRGLSVLQISKENGFCIKIGRQALKLCETNDFDQDKRNRKCWISLKQNGGRIIQKNDIFKLGKIQMRLWSINNEKNELDSTLSNQGTDQCRVCLRGAFTKNPLLNTCKCMGTLKYMHQECLKRWLQEKHPQKNTETSQVYFWKDLQCEICKFQYKPIFQSDSQTYSFMELVRTDKPCLILQFSLKNKADYQNYKCGIGDNFTKKSDGVFVVKLDEIINIGRNSDNNLKIVDSSISRSHSTLQYKDGKLKLFDNNSKYGTLLLLQEDTPINTEISVKVGRSLFKIQPQNLYMC